MLVAAPLQCSFLSLILTQKRFSVPILLFSVCSLMIADCESKSLNAMIIRF